MRSRTCCRNVPSALKLACLTFVAGMLALTSSFPAQAQTYTVLHAFTDGNDGANPYAGVTVDQGGNLYGTAEYGGSGHCGNVFRLKLMNSVWTLTNLYEFHLTDGCAPGAKVVFGPNGTLYGTTASGGPANAGTVFQLQPPIRTCPTSLCLWHETILYNFLGGNADGLGPSGDPVVFDAAGNLYGTTTTGGIGGCDDNTCGTAYQLSPSGGSWTETILQFFGGSSGAIPHGVILDTAGHLYGTSYYDPQGGDGTVFELTKTGGAWSLTNLYIFQNLGEGAGPWAGLVRDQQGNLYGSTGGFGANGAGTIFKIDTADNFSVIYALTNPGGQGSFMGPGPAAKLMMDTAGNLYGTTYGDGVHGFGSVFKLSPSNGGWTYTSLHDFTGGADGGYPVSDVVMDSAGNLYGTATVGGSFVGLCNSGSGCGVVWKITP